MLRFKFIPPPTHRPFRGCVNDLLRCYSLYRSDLSDALSLQFLSSLFLIYFANITLAFVFGAFFSDMTQGAMVSQSVHELQLARLQSLYNTAIYE